MYTKRDFLLLALLLCCLLLVSCFCSAVLFLRFPVLLSIGEIRALFDSVDVDNGKELHFSEFLAATLERRELDNRRLRLAFDRLDFDHSGTIDGATSYLK